MTLGQKIQALRTGANLSQEELAARMGVSRQAISKWELDKTIPDVTYIVKISELFQVTTDYLLKEQATSGAAHRGSVQSSEARSAASPYTYGANPQAPAYNGQDRSALLATLLLCADGFLLVLVLLHFPLIFILHYRLSLIPLLLAVVLAPVFFLLSRAFLRTPACALKLYRRAAACCLTLWGMAIAMLLGFTEVVDDLLFSRVEGWASIPLFLLLTAVLLGGLYAVSALLVHLATRKM